MPPPQPPSTGLKSFMREPPRRSRGRSTAISTPAPPSPGSGRASAIRCCAWSTARRARRTPTRRAYAKFQRPGVYATTVTHPAHFRGYLLEQLEPLAAEYGAEIAVGVSDQEIPYPYVLERVDEIGRSGVTASRAGRAISRPRCSPSWATRWRTGSGEAHDGRAATACPVRRGAGRLFAAPARPLHRQRLAPCAALDPAHQLSPLCRSVRALGLEQPRASTAPTRPWCCRAEREIGRGTTAARPRQLSSPAPWHRFQMPAYHLLAARRPRA